MKNTRWLVHFLYQYDISSVSSKLVTPIQIKKKKTKLIFHLPARTPSWLIVKIHFSLLGWLSLNSFHFCIRHFPRWFNIEYSVKDFSTRWLEKVYFSSLTVNGTTKGIQHLYRFPLFDYSRLSVTLQTTFNSSNEWNLVFYESKLLIRPRYV